MINKLIDQFEHKSDFINYLHYIKDNELVYLVYLSNNTVEHFKII